MRCICASTADFILPTVMVAAAAGESDDGDGRRGWDSAGSDHKY